MSKRITLRREPRTGALVLTLRKSRAEVPAAITEALRLAEQRQVAVGIPPALRLRDRASDPAEPLTTHSTVQPGATVYDALAEAAARINPGLRVKKGLTPGRTFADVVTGAGSGLSAPIRKESGKTFAAVLSDLRARGHA